MENLSKITIPEGIDYETEPRLYIDGNADRGGDHRCAGGCCHPCVGPITHFDTTEHKAKVAADMANVRAYYAELQTQYITTGEYIDIGDEPKPNQREIEFLDGTTVKLQAGQIFAILYRKPDDKPNQRPNSEREPVGYQIAYYCDKGDHKLLLE